MSEKTENQINLASIYAGKWPRSIVYIALALLVSIGLLLLASRFGFIEEVSFRSVAMTALGVSFVVCAAWVGRLIKQRESKGK